MERVEYNFRVSLSERPDTDPPALVPSGMSAFNVALSYANSYYWDKRAMALAPRDHASGELTHWLSDGPYVSDFPGGTKRPLENRVWYVYPAQNQYRVVGKGQPSTIGRVLDDGTAQIHRYEYNAKGLTTKATDALGRETVYVYGSGSTPDPDPATGTGIDLLQVKQKNPSGAVGCTAGTSTGCDLLASYTYNSQHLSLTVTDAAGQTTTRTYLPDRRLQTVVTPPRSGLTAAQRTTTFTYFADNAPTGAGRLQTITGPSWPQGSPTHSFTYDGYGRVRTATNDETYTVTLDYDALDRPTRTTFPDATYEEVVYNRLDAERHRDRAGRYTHAFHDALRRVVTQRDPLGQTLTQQWCTCGSLDKLIDANNNATTWERDLQGRITRETRRDNSATQYVYENTTSRLKQVTDAKLQVTNLEYFLDDTLKQISRSNTQYPTPTVNLTYDANYRRTYQVIDGTGTITHTHHPIAVPAALGAGRLASVDGPLTNDTISYGYDELGRKTGRTIGSTAWTRVFDSLGRLSSETNALGAFTYAYVGTTNRLDTVTYPNGQSTAYAYHPVQNDRRLQEIHHRLPGGATLSKFNYTYDSAQHVKLWTQQLGTNPAKAYDLGYDATDQLA